MQRSVQRDQEVCFTTEKMNLLISLKLNSIMKVLMIGLVRWWSKNCNYISIFKQIENILKGFYSDSL